MSYKCIGCDKSIGWDGRGTFSYTCPCGATILYEETTEKLALPFSLVRALQTGDSSSPHLDYLVGNSPFTSPIKEQIVSQLRIKGFIWMEECEQCQNDGTLKRKREMEAHLALQEAEHIIRTAKQGGEHPL